MGGVDGRSSSKPSDVAVEEADAVALVMKPSTGDAIPSGAEGTFFALLMCIDSLGMLAAKAGGAAVLRALRVTRTDFGNLWLAVLLRNVLRLATLAAIDLVPDAGQTDVLVPRELGLVSSPAGVADDEDEERLQLAMLTSHTDDV